MKAIPKKQARMIARIKRDSFSGSALVGNSKPKAWDNMLASAGVTRPSKEMIVQAIHKV